MRRVSTLAVVTAVSSLLIGVLAPACGGGSDDAASKDDASADGATADGSGGSDGSSPNKDAGTKTDGGGKIECTKSADCDSGVCNIATGKCSAASCADGTKNAGETDIDCGGTCKPCDTGKKCAVAADCTSKV